MKRLIISLTVGLWMFTPVMTQAQEFEDLLNLYIDEKYEKLTQKAYNYTQNDKYRKNPIPYIYCSMGYYEMSKDMSYMEDYPRAQNDALKYAIKFRKKDKKLEHWDDHQDYISELRTTVLEDAENQLGTEKTIKKAHKIYRYLTDLDPSDGAAWLMRGYCEARMRMVTEAGKHVNKKAGTIILGLNKIEDLHEEQQNLMKFGLITYSGYLLDNGMTDSAKTVIDLGFKWFEEDDAYKKKYDEIKSK